MKHKMILFVVLIALFSLVLSVQAQDKSITIWVTGGDSDAVALKAAAAPFEASTGITVNVQAVDWGNAYSQYLTAVNSSSGADIYMGGMSWGISLGGVGGLVDLKKQFPEDIQGILDANNPAFINGIVGTDGAVYGVPYNQDVLLMYYLPDNLKKAGIDAVPTTWDEFTADVTALKTAGLGMAGMNWGNASWLGFQPYLAQAGGSWYTDDCSAAAINSDAGMKALEYYTSLYSDLGFPQEALDASGLNTGTLSILFDGE
ncbi:MAG: extracellular solute-binding protein, partial [Chloroflexota bacterium]